MGTRSQVKTSPKGRLFSLHQRTAEDAADRRAIVEATASNGAPSSAADGFETRSMRTVHVVAKERTGGSASFSFKVWLYREFSGEWALDDAAGTTAVSAGQVKAKLVEASGAERVYIELESFAGSAEVDVWLGASSF